MELHAVGDMNGVLNTIKHSFSSSQKGYLVLQCFISQWHPPAVRATPPDLRSKFTSTWNFFAVEITAFKAS